MRVPPMLMVSPSITVAEPAMTGGRVRLGFLE
jgi:hypothetical protein